MGKLAVLDVAAGLDHLEPAQVANGLRGALDGATHGGVRAFGRGSDDLDDFVDMF